ncbi:SUN domain,Galactose-binding domain-like [Cinara cedri]|uniref:SUN domain,Galactose-binding domain-like n=1 Tax=Cinara cedri TaxID=506608 RepID=A0A5E4N5H0_9HEMI|nr:SUN domain,Galactose-binding domain-like [Cinara cedri]
MTEDLNITIRPSSGLNKSSEEIVKFYNNFDGWQETLPKTDNTYSPVSKYYKYEVSPGIPFIPNMSRLPLKSYEKTPMKHDSSWSLKSQSDNIFTSSHIKKHLFTSTTIKNYSVRNHNETEESLSYTQSKTSKIIKHVYQSITIFIEYITFYFISIFTLTKVHKSIMEIGLNIINTTIQKITDLVHLASISMVHYDLIIMTTIRNIIDRLFGHIRVKYLLMSLLFVSLILFLIYEFFEYTTPLNLPLGWQGSWTNFLISPFISILNLITSIYQIIWSTLYFVFDLIAVAITSSIIAIQLFLNALRNFDSALGSSTHVSTIPMNQNTRFLPFDYNLLASKVIASEEFQRILMNQLNISQTDLVKLHDQEFQQLLKHHLQEMNSNSLNWLNDNLKDEKFTLKNVDNDEKTVQEKETIKLMEKKISDLQNIVSNLINSFETYKSESTNLKTNTESALKEVCFKNDWHSIVNYIEQYVNTTVKSKLNIYDADKTGMVDYALESAGGTVLGTRCTQTKPSTAALTMFGMPLWFLSNGPRLAIQPGVNPGQCWAFIGAKGFLVLKLSKTIHVTGFTIEHLPKLLSENGNIRSAPKDFSIWGLKHETDPDGKLLGKYQFQTDGPSLQYFPTMETNNIFSVVELRIESNHGHEEYTCLYRFRVHGDLA